jgi:hypothetical protein
MVQGLQTPEEEISTGCGGDHDADRGHGRLDIASRTENVAVVTVFEVMLLCRLDRQAVLVQPDGGFFFDC